MSKSTEDIDGCIHKLAQSTTGRIGVHKCSLQMVGYRTVHARVGLASAKWVQINIYNNGMVSNMNDRIVLVNKKLVGIWHILSIFKSALNMHNVSNIDS